VYITLYYMTEYKIAMVRQSHRRTSGVTTDPADPAMRGGPWA